MKNKKNHIFNISAEDAIREMEGRKIDGYRITVDWARRPRRDGPRGMGGF